MPQPPSEPHSSPDNPQKLHVALPDKPPAVTESVAVALLQLLRAMLADPGQQRPEPENT
ncbi:hypothetical protein [Streptomyces broussonetiae]|uniref:hypothetical protein n=1 Tax=Streptomyces broussonetiae TaxID=2686304 RepID=UPI0018EECF90|nr:hypothetical protein [Streptomyces broussonetiae]